MFNGTLNNLLANSGDDVARGMQKQLPKQRIRQRVIWWKKPASI